MTKEDLRKKYERIHFEESDTPRGKLKQNYAKWLEKELIKQLTIPVVSQQRELLKFFSAQLSENLDIDVGMNYITEEDIEECLKNFNCG